MNNIERHQTNKRLSQMVICNGTIYLAGQVAADRTQDAAGQTRQVLENIDALLRKAGSDKSRILFAQVWLKNIERDFGRMNQVWENWTAEGAAPARATVESNLAAADILVEIAVTASV